MWSTPQCWCAPSQKILNQLSARVKMTLGISTTIAFLKILTESLAIGRELLFSWVHWVLWSLLQGTAESHQRQTSILLITQWLTTITTFPLCPQSRASRKPKPNLLCISCEQEEMKDQVHVAFMLPLGQMQKSPAFGKHTSSFIPPSHHRHSPAGPPVSF